MLFASGSGVDPHISLDSALLQVKRISKERAFDSSKSDKLIFPRKYIYTENICFSLI